MTFSAAEVQNRQSVYVVSGGPRYLKIGIAGDIAQRLRDLQSASPIPLQVWYLGQTKGRPEAMKAERRAHQLLQSHRAHGEWFHVSVKMAVDALIVACGELDLKLAHLKDPRSTFRPGLDDRDARRCEKWLRAVARRRGRR